MLRIRLQRVGRRHDPSFRVVVTDRRNAAGRGRAVEVLGHYDARKKTPQIKGDRVLAWMAKGAQPSETVHGLLKRLQVIH